jgi:hypothetical protein
MTTEERLQRLEKFMADTVGSGGEIIAKNFVLEDENGKSRAVLAVVEGCPALILLSENAKPSVILSATKDGPSLSMGFTNDGVPLADLTVKAGYPALCLSDEGGRPRAILSATKDGPSLNMGDDNGKLRATMSVAKSVPWNSLMWALVDKGFDVFNKPGVTDDLAVVRPMLRLYDEDHKSLWSAP